MSALKLKWMSYPEDKQKIAESMGYDTFYNMLVGEYRKGYSSCEISKYAETTPEQIIKILRALGEEIKPRGGRNNAVIPEWGANLIRSHKRLTKKLKCEYASMFLCAKTTVQGCWAGRGYVQPSIIQRAFNNEGKFDGGANEI